MKKSVTFLPIWLLAVGLWAQPATPQPVYSITRAMHPLSFYQAQYEAWEAVLAEEASDPAAWRYRYAAARAANLRGMAPKYDLDSLIRAMQENLDEHTFEYHYLLSWHAGLGAPGYAEHLRRASALAPERWELYDQLIAYHLTQGDTGQAAVFCRRWLESGEVSAGLLHWNYNALMSVEPGGILLTYGDNDTYPAWLLQYGRGIRQDVTVLNLHLLQLPDYRHRVLRALGLPPKEKMPTARDPRVQKMALLRHLVEHATQPLYLGISLESSLREPFEDQLYLVGLAFKYQAEPFDNLALLRRNYEQHFLLDHLRLALAPDISSSVLDIMNLNYLPPLLMLHRQFEKENEANRAAELKNLIFTIAKRAGREEEVDQYFLPAKSQGSIRTNLRPRDLEKLVAPVSDGLYAGITETSNQLYRQFLEDLLHNEAFEPLQASRTYPTVWRDLLPPSRQDLPDAVVFQLGHPDDPDFPVQNIGYAGAVHFCDWLTRVYNEIPDKKKEFKKVRFRLPTAEEWMRAARATNAFAPYPWGGYEAQNAKGCYLGNFYVTEAPPCEECPSEALQPANDGGFFTVKVDAYFPNPYNLYNLAGNVAEMTLEKGLAMGGSWSDRPEDCQVDSRQHYDGPSPAIGFRFFMEVVEE